MDIKVYDQEVLTASIFIGNISVDLNTYCTKYEKLMKEVVEEGIKDEEIADELDKGAASELAMFRGIIKQLQELSEIVRCYIDDINEIEKF